MKCKKKKTQNKKKWMLICIDICIQQYVYRWNVNYIYIWCI